MKYKVIQHLDPQNFKIVNDRGEILGFVRKFRKGIPGRTFWWYSKQMDQQEIGPYTTKQEAIDGLMANF